VPGFATSTGATGPGSTATGPTGWTGPSGPTGYTGGPGYSDATLVINCSDEAAPLSAGTAKVTFRMPFLMTLTAVRASLTAAQTAGSILTVDINEEGVSVLSTKLTIDNNEETSVTAATQPVISDISLADNAEITIDVDQVGNGTAKGLKVYLYGPANSYGPTGYQLTGPTGVTGSTGAGAPGATGPTGTVDGVVIQNSQSAAYTTVASDAGKHIFHPSADTTARIWTIAANSSVPYTIGTAISFINQNSAGVITIAIATDTMRLAGAGTTGNRTLAANGVATAVKVATTEWLISGTGLT
jgi:hypothetical protein